jgi:hypothetical protein
VNIIVTIIGMWIGSISVSTSDDEQARVDEFFSHMDVPTEPKIDRVGQVQSPFGVVGIALLLFGGVILICGIVLRFKSGDSMTFVLNLIASGVMLLIGVLLWFGSRKK